MNLFCVYAAEHLLAIRSFHPHTVVLADEPTFWSFNMHLIRSEWNDDTSKLTNEHTILSNLALVVRRRRNKLGLTASQVSEKSNISPADYAALELGEWDIDIISLSKIAAGLSMDLSQLMKSLHEQSETELNLEVMGANRH